MISDSLNSIFVGCETNERTQFFIGYPLRYLDYQIGWVNWVPLDLFLGENKKFLFHLDALNIGEFRRSKLTTMTNKLESVH